MCYAIRYTGLELEIISQFPVSVCSARLVLPSRGQYLTYLNAANNDSWHCKLTAGNYNLTPIPTFEFKCKKINQIAFTAVIPAAKAM